MKIADLEFNESHSIAALAPMAGATDRAFREICAQFGAAYVVTEMVSAKAIVYKNSKTLGLLELSDIEQPAVIQIFGYEPDVMAEAANMVMKYNPKMIDINMGCPVPKITSNFSGASLMKSPKLCYDIVKSVKQAINIPLTVKIRKGWDENSINAVEIAQICQEAGADAIVVHGRTRSQMYRGDVDLDIIRQVKMKLDVPVIGNGDVSDVNSAMKMLDYCKCDMIMVGRAALGNPWIFRDINAFINNGVILEPASLDERLSLMFEHVKRMCDYKGERIAMQEARKHVAWYIKGLYNAAYFRDKASRLGKLEDLEKLINEIKWNNTET